MKTTATGLSIAIGLRTPRGYFRELGGSKDVYRSYYRDAYLRGYHNAYTRG